MSHHWRKLTNLTAWAVLGWLASTLVLVVSSQDASAALKVATGGHPAPDATMPGQLGGHVSIDSGPKPPMGATAAAAAATTTTTTTTSNTTTTNSSPATSNDDVKRFEEFKQSKFYTPPYDPQILALPGKQRAFISEMLVRNIVLYKQILREAVENRNRFAPSAQLMFKFTGKLLGQFIKNRREEKQVSPRVEPASSFFVMVADLVQSVIDKSAQVRKERAYKKANVDVEAFERRVNSIFDYIQRLVDASPVAAYLKWNELVLLKDEPSNVAFNKPLVEEASDLLAQFRAIGYDNTIFVAKRIVNLLRMFSRGILPSSDKEV